MLRSQIFTFEWVTSANNILHTVQITVTLQVHYKVTVHTVCAVLSESHRTSGRFFEMSPGRLGVFTAIVNSM